MPGTVFSILVADDDPTICMALSRLLERRGHRVSTAPSATKALKLAEQSMFDVGLIDVRMPGDGLQLVRRLRENRGMVRHVIIMTGGDAREIAQFDDLFHLRKPFDFDAMVRLVEGLAAT